MTLTRAGFQWVAPVLAAVLGLLVITGVALAQEESDSGDHRGIVGEVVVDNLDAEGMGTVVVQTAEGEEITITVGASSEVKTPGTPAVTDVAGSLGMGAQVAVLIDGGGNAIQVLVKPQRPTAPPETGAVVGIQDGILTIMRPDGSTKEVRIPEGAGAPDTGEIVTTFASETDDVGPATATGLVRAAEVRDRLTGFLAEATPTEDAENGEIEQQEEELNELAQILDRYTQQHLNVLDGLLAREDLPAEARDAFTNAKSMAERGRDEAIQRTEEAQARMSEARERQGPPTGENGGAPPEGTPSGGNGTPPSGGPSGSSGPSGGPPSGSSGGGAP